MTQALLLAVRATARTLLLPVLLLTALALLPACETGPTTSDRVLAPMTYEELTDRLRTSRQEEKMNELAIVDVRPREQYVDGHIPGAIHIPLPDMTSGDPRLSSAEHIIVYGEDYEDMLGTAGAKKLSALGYEGVRLYRDGFEDWARNQRRGF